jgi:hypothetical protein
MHGQPTEAATLRFSHQLVELLAGHAK